MSTLVSNLTETRQVEGSSQHKVDRTADGTVWSWVWDGTRARAYYSKNNGTTWAYAGTTSAISCTADFSCYIDSADVLHVAWTHVDNGRNYIRYRRAVPNAGRTAWSWPLGPLTITTIRNSAARPDIVVTGSGPTYAVHIVAGFRNGGEMGVEYVRVLVDSGGNYSLTDDRELDLIAAVSGWDVAPVIDAGQPGGTHSLYVAWGYPVGSGGARLQRGRLVYGGAGWTWDADVQLSNEAVVNQAIAVAFDGSNAMVAYGVTANLRVKEYQDTGGAIVDRQPTGYAGGDPLGVGVTYEWLASSYVAVYSATNDDPRYAIFSRVGGNVWGAWTTIAVASPGSATRRLSVRRRHSHTSIDVLYQDLSASPYAVRYERVPASNHTPNAPIPKGPASGTVLDLAAAGGTFSWQFSDQDYLDFQGSWAMRRRIGTGAYSWWSEASQTWAGAETWNAGAASSKTFGPGQWTGGTTYLVSVATKDAAGAISPYFAELSITAGLTPTVVVTAPVDPYTLDTRPVMAHTFSAGADPQRSAHYKVFSPAQYNDVAFDPATSSAVWSSGEIFDAGLRSLQVGVDLTVGEVYRFYAQASKSGPVYSAWVYAGAVIDLEAPATPMLSAQVERNLDTGCDRVRLTVQGTDSLLNANQGDLATGVTGWANDANATVATDVLVGLTYLKLTSVAAGDMRAGTPADTTAFPVRGDATYTAVADVPVHGTARITRLVLRFYNAGGAQVGTTSGTGISDAAEYTATVSARAPVSADRAQLLYEVVGTAAAGEIHRARRFSLRPGTATGWSRGGLSGAQTFRVERSDDGGLSYGSVRNGSAVVPDAYQRVTLYDREMPLGVALRYRAASTQPNLASAISPDALVTFEARAWYLRDPLNVANEAEVLVVGHSTRQLEPMEVHRPAGRTIPLVQHEPLQVADHDFTIATPTPVHRVALDRLLALQRTLLIQSPAGNSWYVRVEDRQSTDTDAAGASYRIPALAAAKP